MQDGSPRRDPELQAGQARDLPAQNPMQPARQSPEPTFRLKLSVLPLTSPCSPPLVSFQFKYPNCLLAEINRQGTILYLQFN